MATVARKMMDDVLAAEAPQVRTHGLLHDVSLRMQQAIAYDGHYVTSEPIKMMNLAYKAFGIKCPDVIPDPAKCIVAQETGGKSG